MEFITKLHLGEEKSLNHYQCIYSSQLYGTFFSIFALVDADHTDGDDYYTLKGIDLKIVNYKGIVNIGIVGAELIDSTSTTNGKGDVIKGKSLLIGVKALEDTPKDVPVVIETDSMEFKIGSEILVERFLMPMHKRTPSKDGTFDSELFYREGLYNPTPNGYEVRLWDDRPKKGNYVAPITVQAAGGWVCPFMLLILI